MGIIITILLVFIFLFLWLIFVPLVVEVDTDHNLYQIRQHGTFRFWISPDFHLNLRILGFTVPINKRDKNHEPPTVKKNTRKQSFSLHPNLDLIKRIFRSITLRWLHLNVDTDNVVLNAQLIPVCLFLSRGPVYVTTNFDGRVYASLRAEVKVYRIGWAFLLFSLKQKMYEHQF